MTKLKISLSAKNPQTDAFIATCLLMMKSLSGGDVASLKANFKSWATVAKPFAAKFGVQKEYISSCNDMLRSNMEFDDVMSADLASWLKPLIPLFQRDTSIDATQLQLLKDVNTYSRRDSPTALKRITKNVTHLGMHELSAAFVHGEELGDETVESVKADASFLRNTVQTRTGKKNDMQLNVDEMKKLREEDPELYSKYMEKRKNVVSAFKTAIHQYVRKSGKPYVEVEEARRYLKTYDCDWIPVGYVGNIDDTGALYTATGRKLVQAVIGEVVMNQKYDATADNTYVCSVKGKPNSGVRTVEFMRGNKEAAFGKVNDFTKDFDKYRALWLRDLRAPDARVRLHATLVEMMYCVQARIGGTANKPGVFGISTLRRQHFKITPTKITIDYAGKKGTPQHHEIHKARDKQLYENIVMYYKATSGADDPVFFINGAVQSTMQITRYLNARNIKITPHKFRHIKGTGFALEVLEKSPFKSGRGAKVHPSQSEAERWFKEAMKEVGEKLHHQTGGNVTSSTAIQSYIDPAVSANFFTELGLRVPKWVPKLGSDD